MEETQSPGLLRYVLGFLCVGIAWGFTTPFIRRAALEDTTVAPTPSASSSASSTKKKQQQQQQPQEKQGASRILMRKLKGAWIAVLDLLSRPAYTIPLLINLSGSALFFLIVGQAELSLTVPITNSLAFLFTVLGEWVAEGKSITKETWIGMVFVLAGIAICVHAKASDI